MRVLAVNEWNQFHSFCSFAVIKSFKIEKFHSFLSASCRSSLHISVVYMKAPYKAVSYKKNRVVVRGKYSSFICSLSG